MSNYRSQIKFAKMIGVSRKAIREACTRGTVYREELGIDLEHPTNKLYMKLAKERLIVRSIAAAKSKEIKPEIKKVKRKKKHNPGRPKKKVSKKEIKAYEEKKALEQPEEEKEEYRSNDLAIQKIIEDIRLKKTKADLASLDLSRKMDVMIDRESLMRKFGAFFDCLLNDLVYMPEGIADLLVMKVRGNKENAEQIVEDELKIRIQDIIKNAKKAAAEITPPDKGIKYIIIDQEDEEIDLDDAI